MRGAERLFGTEHTVNMEQKNKMQNNQQYRSCMQCSLKRREDDEVDKHSNFKVNASRAVPRLLLGSALAGFQAGQPEDCIPARYFTVRQGLGQWRGAARHGPSAAPSSDGQARQPSRAAKQGSQAGQPGCSYLQRASARFVA